MNAETETEVKELIEQLKQISLKIHLIRQSGKLNGRESTHLNDAMNYIADAKTKLLFSYSI